MRDASIADDWMLDVAGETYAFGGAFSPVALEQAPVVSAADQRVGDVDRQRGDGRRMGRDDEGGLTVTFELTIVASSTTEARAHRDEMQRLWRGDAIRHTPGALAELRAPSGRSVFGRPRRFQGDDALLQEGSLDPTAEFAAVEAVWYGQEVETTVPFVPVPSGGLEAPLRAPLTTTRTSDRSQVVTIGGELPTPVVFEVLGPITNPAVFIGPLQFHFATTLAYDERLIYDGRSWRRTITRGGARSGSLAGTVTAASTRLLDAQLAPGEYDLALRGISQTANASLKLRHRPAHPNY